LLADVVLNAALLKDRVSDFELSMRFTIEPVCVPGTIKLMHCGLADRAKEGPGQRSILIHFLVKCLSGAQRARSGLLEGLGQAARGLGSQERKVSVRVRE